MKNLMGLVLCALSALTIAFVRGEEELQLQPSILVQQLTEELNAVAEHRERKDALLSLDRISGDRACWRNLKPRKGHVPSREHPCDTSTEVKESGICYEKCPALYQGLGPTCLSECRCKLNAMSLFFCCSDKDVCTALVSEVVTKLPLELSQLIVDLVREQLDAQKILHDFRALMETAINLALPMCDNEIPTGCQKHAALSENAGYVTLKEAL